MSYEDHSEDVASDFRDALEGLTMNSRVEIATLTVIARENTEYAHGIAEVLQEHIKKVTPPRKLPALYLLDSIVKNVGTPYTIYFSRGLYSTFMDAYASVDNATRRKMDEMLRTWKEPAPGSVDPRPVFSPETTRPIENALLRARSSALQAQQEHMRSEQQLFGRGRPLSATPYRETPTPPGGRPPFAQPGPYGQPPPQPTTQTTPQPALHPTAGGPFPPPTPQLQQLQLQQQQRPLGPFAPPAAASRVTLEALNEDVERLIQATKVEFAEKSYDASVAGRLKALLDLQAILKSQNLEYDKLVLVRNQIDALAVNLPGHLKAQAGPTPTPPAAGYPPYQPPPAPHHPPPQHQQHQHQQLPPTSAGAPAAGQPISAAVLAALAAAQARQAGATAAPSAAPAPPPVAPPQPAPTGLSIESLLGPGALAALLAARQQQQLPQSGPYVPPAAPQPSHRPPAMQAAFPPAAASTAPAAGAASNPLALVDMLKKAGIIQRTSASGAASRGPSQAPASSLPPSLNGPGLANIIASVRAPATLGVREPLREIQNEISFQSDSLKTFRPHLLPLLFEDLGPPCTQCGRRFRTDDAGRTAKTAHMDWHFRVHQRIVEAEKRGQHRSWYVDQADWVHSRETVDIDGAGPGGDGGSGSGGGAGHEGSHAFGSGAASGAGGGAGSGGGAAGKLQWIPVPTGSASTNQSCPICQEKFEMKWLDEAQEWVWIDAVKVGSRVYHASCHAEAARTGSIRDHPAAAAMSAMMAGAAGSSASANGGGGLPLTSMPIPTGPAADRARQQPALGKRKADDGFHGNGKAHGGGKNGGGGNRKKKRGGLGSGGPRRPPDLDRVDPDIGGGGAASGDGAGGGRFHGRSGGKNRGGGGGGGHNNDNSEDAKVDLNALPY